MRPAETANGRDEIFLSAKLRWLHGLLLALLMLGGALFRLSDLTDAPLDFHPTRQIRSAIIARGMYYQNLPGVPEWQREYAIRQWQAQELIEPAIIETLSAATYVLAGGEYPWIGRLYSILFWLLGGVGLYLLARRLMDTDSALIALALYLGWQYAIIASRSFQPDPLMVAAVVWALWGLVEWQRQPGWGRAMVAGLLGGLALYIKFTAVFFIAGGWLGVIVAGGNWKGWLRNRQFWLAAGLIALLPLMYSLYATLVLGSLQSQFSLRFFPAMWIDAVTYLRWWNRLIGVIAMPWLAVAALGFFTLRERSNRGLLLGWGAGYLIYGLLFSYYTATHDYYHLPLLPLAALGAGAALRALFHRMSGNQRWLCLVVALVVALIFLSEGWAARTLLRRVNYRAEVARIEQIAAQFSPQDHLVSMAEHYSLPLVYWGWLRTTHWFGAGDFALREAAGQPIDLQAYFQAQLSGRDFFLITDFEELDRQPQVEEWLNAHFPVFAQGEGYRVYDIRQQKESE
jgi:4-amino-4-deoxy-L-arabinose transferase-like glycosyltransferase